MLRRPHVSVTHMPTDKVAVTGCNCTVAAGVMDRPFCSINAGREGLIEHFIVRGGKRNRGLAKRVEFAKRLATLDDSW